MLAAAAGETVRAGLPAVGAPTCAEKLPEWPPGTFVRVASASFLTTQPDTSCSKPGFGMRFAVPAEATETNEVAVPPMTSAIAAPPAKRACENFTQFLHGEQGTRPTGASGPPETSRAPSART